MFIAHRSPGGTKGQAFSQMLIEKCIYYRHPQCNTPQETTAGAPSRGPSSRDPQGHTGQPGGRRSAGRRRRGRPKAPPPACPKRPLAAAHASREELSTVGLGAHARVGGVLARESGSAADFRWRGAGRAKWELRLPDGGAPAREEAGDPVCRSAGRRAGSSPHPPPWTRSWCCCTRCRPACQAAS